MGKETSIRGPALLLEGFPVHRVDSWLLNRVVLEHLADGVKGGGRGAELLSSCKQACLHEHLVNFGLTSDWATIARSVSTWHRMT